MSVYMKNWVMPHTILTSWSYNTSHTNFIDTQVVNLLHFSEKIKQTKNKKYAVYIIKIPSPLKPNILSLL